MVSVTFKHGLLHLYKWIAGAMLMQFVCGVIFRFMPV